MKRGIDPLLCSARRCLHALLFFLFFNHVPWQSRFEYMKAYANSHHVVTFAEISPSLFLF